MPRTADTKPIARRTLLKAGAAAGALQITSPFIIAARGEASVKIGMVDPLTGVYAAVAESEVAGAKDRHRQHQPEGRHTRTPGRTPRRGFGE